MTNNNENFYKITGMDIMDAEDNVSLLIKFNPEHNVFKGHFPDQPVVPGVCLIEIITDCLSGLMRMPCKLVESDYIKFLKPIIPNTADTYTLNIALHKLSVDEVIVEAIINIYSTKYLKFKGIFSRLSA
jgi:3-hydroxyacyl-[acyl-carrier-protein] dehydratase